MRRSLSHYRRAHLAVALAAAVACAVLTGALLVGDSVRGSLGALAEARLGRIDHAVVGARFVRQELAAELAAAELPANRGVTVAPALVLRGSATAPDSGRRASEVTVLGIDERFAELYPGETGLLLGQASGLLFAPVALNASLARELGVGVGDAVVLSFERLSDVPQETLVGRADADRALEALRLSVAAILPDRGAGGLQLDPLQAAPANAFVDLKRLARALEKPGKANALWIASGKEQTRPELESALLGRLSAEDAGAKVFVAGGQVVVESVELVLTPRLAETARTLGAELGASVQPVLTYLANELSVGAKSLPYSTVAALDALPAERRLRLANGEAAPPLADGEAYLNAWAAAQLGARGGETLRLTYYHLGARDELVTREVALTVRGVVAQDGLGADPSLTPELPGVSDSENMADWEPPFPVDLGRVRPADEAYWDQYRAAPKAFVALATGQRLWQSRFGSLTSLRLTPPAGTSAETLADSLRAQLPERLTLAGTGLSVRSLAAEAAEAAQGSTDFGQLFLAFSFFLIVAAALLLALLFRLAVEQRAREVGLLAALGFPQRAIRRRFFTEGSVVAAVGALVGLVGAIAYAGLLLLLLRTWWQPAVGTSELYLHVSPGTLAIGWFATVEIMALAVWLALRRLLRVPPPRLLAGSVAESGTVRSGRLPLGLALGSGLAALALLVAMLGGGRASSPALAFGVGGALLVCGLASFAFWLRRHQTRRANGLGGGGLLAFGARNSRWNAGRSLLAVALVAAASFVLVAVGAQRGARHADVFDRASGAGGFALVAKSAVPIVQDLNRPEGREAAGLPANAEALAQARVFPLRVRPGEDASCLNLYRPGDPRILGVPPDLAARGGFAFQATARPVENPWTLLDEELGEGVVPAFADANSAQWILKLGLGDDLVIEDEAGKPLRLRLVGLFAKSVFQSELLIAEAAFVRHFPSRAGYASFLVEVPPAATAAATQALESGLAAFGFDAQESAERLAVFERVEQTYLSTFQLLGGLGLLLGTIGLGVVLLRNVLERERELAALAALGFPRRRLAALVVAENAFLLLVGLGLGASAALVAVAPHLARAGSTVPWLSLAATLGLVLAIGLAASRTAVRALAKRDLVAGLRAE